MIFTIMILVGLFLFLLFMSLIIKKIVVIKKRKNTVEGVIIDAENAGGEGIRGIFEYYVEGEHYINKTSWSSNGSYHAGTKVKVYYDRCNPKESHIKGFALYTNMFIYAVFALVGILICFLGIFLKVTM